MKSKKVVDMMVFIRHVVKDGPDWTGLVWTGKTRTDPCFTNRGLNL
jgi:hypothetical protein